VNFSMLYLLDNIFGYNYRIFLPTMGIVWSFIRPVTRGGSRGFGQTPL